MTQPSPPDVSTSSGEPVGQQSGVRRRPENLWMVLRSFGRLWGFSGFLLGVVLVFRGVALPFIFGLLIAYLLAPVVARLQPHVGRGGAVVLCYLALTTVLALFVGLLLPAVTRDFARLRGAVPGAVERFNEDWLPRAEAWVESEFGVLATDASQERMPETTTELIVEPLPDGRLRVDLRGVRLSVIPQDDGSWIVGTNEESIHEDPSIGLGAGVRDFVSEEVSGLVSMLGPAVQLVVAAVAGFLTSFVITFMVAAFVLIDLSRVNRFARSLVPTQYLDSFEELWASMDRGLSGVIRGQLIICMVNGGLTLVGLLMFGVKYAFLLALLAAAFSLIPVFGTIISSIPIVVIAAISGTEGVDLTTGALMLGWILLIHLLEGNVLNPKIIGDSAQIHPVIVIFALLAGEHVLGLTGALLAIPATSIVQAAYLHARRRSSAFSRETEVE